MISNQSLSKNWIMSIREKSQIHNDPIVIEKMILALVLLENLYISGLKFVFKGGSCLLLLLGKLRRFSIDIDIVLETAEGIEEAIRIILEQGVFLRFEEDMRSSNVPKSHYKFFFNSVIEEKESYILLDILFEKNTYPENMDVSVKSELIIIDGTPNHIKCPTFECLLGDKLTAFAPHTTGIQYGKDKELEIIKQLYDIGLLFDVVSNIKVVGQTFNSVAYRELTYRGLVSISTTDVLNDTLNTACVIGMQGFGSMNEYTELIGGIKKLSGFVYLEHFTLDSAILCAGKTAYLATLILKGAEVISRFNPEINLSNTFITDVRYNKLNKVKKTSPEAFYYFYKALTG